ncbi:MAG: fibronectin type III domain-containing protein, partial [Acidobacteriaceae bacterium]
MTSYSDQAKITKQKGNMAKILVFAMLFSLLGMTVSDTARADFTARCTAAGVAFCSGFDSFSEIDYFSYWSETGNYPTLDQTVKASGNGSMKFTIPSLTPTNSSGGWGRVVDETSNGYEEGSTFYVQFRQRLSPEMLNQPMGGNGWKQMEITSTYGAYGDPYNIGLYNQNLAGTATLYVGSKAYTPITSFKYVSDQWMTFYIKVSVGSWGQANSSVAVWASDETHQLTQIYNESGVTLDINPRNPAFPGYNQVILAPENVGKLATTSHLQATTWYDELIVSPNAIADPFSDNQAPTVPANLSATAVSANQINLSWSASTDNSGGAVKYNVYRNGSATPLASGITATTFSDTGLAENTTYSYAVSAVDGSNNQSALSIAKQATTWDVTAPSAPVLAGVAASSGQINLSWNVPYDNVGVTGYKIYRNNSTTEMATVAVNSYSDATVAGSTTYTYRVAAFDARGNQSVLSNSVVVATPAPPDTEAPSVPANLTAAAVSSSQIDLSWSASTDNKAVTGYKIFRNGSAAEIATVSGTTYQNTGLTPSTAYSYTVSAFDAAGNNSSKSTPAQATTQNLLDTTAPTVPAGLSAAAVSSSQINLSWLASSDNIRVTGYRIYRNGTEIGTSAVTSYQNTGLDPATSYSYTLAAFDAAGNLSGQSQPATATTQVPPDTTAPSVPTGLAATVVSVSQINLSWNASTDNVGVAGYRIFQNGNLIDSTTATSYQNINLKDSTTYTYTVSAFDAKGNVSAQSSPASAKTLTPADTTAPSVPANLSATPASESEIDLSWSASTDNVAVKGYNLYRDGSLIATVTALSYRDSGLSSSTTYSYSAEAFDAANNISAKCSPVSATTKNPPDTEAPSVPTGLIASNMTESEIDLLWDASTDNVAVAGYKVYRNEIEAGNTGITSYRDVRLTSGTSYTYEIAAFDAAGNLSGRSQSITAQTNQVVVPVYPQIKFFRSDTKRV